MKTEILNKFSFYRTSTTATQEKIAAAAGEVRLSAGDMFCRQGAAGDQFALLGRGSIRVYRIGESGREITIYHVRDGETCLVNMLSVFLRQPAVANAQIVCSERWTVACLLGRIFKGTKS